MLRNFISVSKHQQRVLNAFFKIKNGINVGNCILFGENQRKIFYDKGSSLIKRFQRETIFYFTLFIFLCRLFSLNMNILQIGPSCFLNTKSESLMSLFSGIKPVRMKSVCVNESIGEGRSYFESFINVSGCFFSRTLLFFGDGGVISVLHESLSLQIRNSMFFRCTSSNYGGAIYFISENSSIKDVCAYKCTANYYHFAYLDASKHNHVEHLSMSLCSNSTSGSYPLYMKHGISSLINTNISFCKSFQDSGICIVSPFNFASSHCNFYRNEVSNSICIYFQSNNSKMSYSNIINNNSPYSYGIIFITEGGSPILLECVFHMNANTLIYLNSGSIEITCCFIIHIGPLSAGNPIISNNNTFTKRETFNIEFLGSKYCILEDEEPQPSIGLFSILLFIFLISVIVFLFVFGLKHRRIASVLLERHQLEESLQGDFG